MKQAQLHYTLTFLSFVIGTSLSAQIISFPYSNGFEPSDDLALWEFTDLYNCTEYWFNTQFSQDYNAGPAQAYQGSYFAHAGFQGCNSGQYVKTLATPAFDISSLSQPELVFYTHIFGVDHGTLTVTASYEDSSPTTMLVIDTQLDPQQQSNSDPWTKHTVDLSTLSEPTFSLEIVASANAENIVFGLDAFSIQEASTTINGRGDITYTYDEAGNRVTRILEISLLDPNEQLMISRARSIKQEKIVDPHTDMYQIYPNPTSNYVHIEALQKVESTQVYVFDIMGKELAQSNMGSATHKVDMTGYKSGSYVLWIQSGDTVVTRKILKY